MRRKASLILLAWFAMAALCSGVWAVTAGQAPARVLLSAVLGGLGGVLAFVLLARPDRLRRTWARMSLIRH